MTKTENELLAELLRHVEHVCGPLSRETCEVPGDDDYSVLRGSFQAVLRTEHPASPASEAGEGFPQVRAAQAKLIRQTHEKAKTLLGTMLNWSDSEFVHAVAGEYGEDLKARIEGVIGNLLDHSASALSRPSSESDARVELLTSALKKIANARTAMDGGSISECRRIASKALAKLEQGGAGDASNC